MKPSFKKDYSLLIHRRQFVLGPEPLKIKESWRVEKVKEKLFLSFCPELPVRKTVDSRGDTLFLLGIALQTDPGRGEPLRDLESSKDIPETVYESWSGRWLLISGGEAHMDAAGILGCYYTKKDGQLWVSSSVAILSDILGSYRVSGKLPCGSMNWFPPPSSGHPEIRSLLPSQILSFPEGRLRPRRLVRAPKLKYSGCMDEMQTRLVTVMREMGRLKKNIWIPLSAGYDSRLLLAAAIYAGLSVKTYTMVKENRVNLFSKKPRTSFASGADMKLPAEIASRAGVDHKWVYPEKISEELLDVFDNHTYKQTIDNDRVYFARRQWDWASEKDLIVLGQVFGVGAQFYHKLFKAPGTIPVEGIIRKKFSLKKGSVFTEGITEWRRWVKKDIEKFNEEFDWRERFYYEQRLGGWLASMQQGLDLAQGEKVLPANCFRIINLMLTLSGKNRGNVKTYEVELIKRMCPGLLEVPFNPPDPLRGKLKKGIMFLSSASVSEAVNKIKEKIF